MSHITTHILDASQGRPATAVKVALYRADGAGYTLIDEKHTDSDGRIKNFAIDTFSTGDYQLIFHVQDYFQHNNTACFYPRVTIDFSVNEATQHYHVPLLISPYAYSTYRGS